MANQKEYKIIINGIKESIDGIGTLQDSLDKLGKKVEESGGHFQTASKGMDELAKTNQKIAQYNEEYQKALAANKAVLADNAKAIKSQLDLEKANLTVQANLQDTYAQKQQLLTALGKVIKNTTGDTSALKEQYASLNQELKDFDAELGNHQRNVGDYEIATKSLKAQLKEIQEEMANMLANGVDKADPKFVELSKKAGTLKDAMGDARQEVDRFASDTKKLDDVVNIAQSATAAFTLYKGAMSAFGIETEGAVEAIQKLQGAMAILQSLKQLQESLNQNSATAKLFSKAMSMMGLSMDGAATSAKALKVALVGIGIGIIIALIAELTEHWEDLAEAIGLSTKAQKEANKEFSTGVAAYAKAKAELTALLIKLETFNGTKKQEKELIEECNRKYGDAFGHYKTLAKWKDTLITKTEQYCQAMFLEAQMQEIINKLVKETERNEELKRKVAKGDNRTILELLTGQSLSGMKKDLAESTNLIKNYKEQLLKNQLKLQEIISSSGLFPGDDNGGGKGGGGYKDKVEQAQKIFNDYIKSQIEGLEAAQALKDEIDKKNKKALEEEQKRLERLKKLRDKDQDAEYKYQKARLELDLEYAETEEEKIKIKQKLLDLETKIAKENAIAVAAEQMGLSTEELQQRLEMTDEKWVGLNEEQKQVLKTLLTQLATIDTAAETAGKKLSGSSGGGSTGDSGNTQNPLAKFFDNNIVQGFVDATLDSIAVIGDAIADLYDMELEEMEEKLDQLAELHDEAVEKVNESQDKISDLNQKMKDSSGAQLEAYKQQMADEMLLLQQRQQEEKRTQKEKEKQEEAIKKKQKQARKDEMKVQLIESIVNTALAVTKTFSAYPMPFAAILGGIVSALGAIQQAIIIKQMSKLADGGLLSGPSHANGGIQVGNTGVEVEGGEYVVNKRSTAKYLPLLQSINEEGARHKTVANQIGKMADGGQLNYERINSNLDSLSTASIVASAIGGIDLHPVVSVVDINRGQRNYTEVRQLAGANN